MLHRGIDLRKPATSSESCTGLALQSSDFYQTHLHFGSHSDGSVETLNKILKQLARMDLPGKEHAEGYLRHMARCFGGFVSCGALIIDISADHISRHAPHHPLL
jgi:hypothetical protein